MTLIGYTHYDGSILKVKENTMNFSEAKEIAALSRFESRWDNASPCDDPDYYELMYGSKERDLEEPEEEVNE